MDLYFSPLQDTYIVAVNKLTGIHAVSIDPTVKYENRTAPNDPPGGSRDKRAITKMIQDIAVDDVNLAENETDSKKDGNSVFSLHEREAEGFITFIKIKDPAALLIVRNIQNRLVITLPNTHHNLKQARYYLVLYGRGQPDHPLTLGNVFFRQDQPRIDLFVFFSVFFSCFFLFLAGCVLMWKVKQAVDSRRSNHMRRLEMQHMASRPFGKVLLLVETNQYHSVAQASPPLLRKTRLPKLNSKHYCSTVHPTNNQHPAQNEADPFHVYPVTVEPMDDGIAAIGTVILQLPGGSTSPMQACLGSSLITTRVMYPSQHHHHIYGSKSTINIRRRPSISV